nr:serine/threonine-protein kinase [Mycobacterium sp. PS03-16]
MAEVRDGWDHRLNRAVAVKLLHPGFQVDPTTRIRFDAEARAAASLNHPSIVSVHDSGEHHGTPFIVMERLPGTSLADAIARGPVAQPLLRQVLDDVLSALSAAHDAGIVHRDIKPGNILFTPAGRVKVSDFGIAKSTGPNLTAAGEVVGTMAYVSPERLTGRPATAADDLYSLGVVAYEALAGRRPFPQEDVASLARAILDHRPTPLAALRPDVDPGLAAVIERAIGADVAQRFSSARQMREALAHGSPAMPAGPAARPATAVLTSPVPPATVLPPAPPPSASLSRRKGVLTVAAMVAALLLAVVLLVADPPFDSTQPATPTPSSPTTAPPSTSPPQAPTTAPATTPDSGVLSEEELKKREEQEKKREEQLRKRLEEERKKLEEQRNNRGGQ